MPEIASWETVWQVERDICFLYHELAEHDGIDGDLAYSLMYNLPYWNFLEAQLPSMSAEEASFVRNGCLLFILAMAWDLIDGSGSYLQDYRELCRRAVNNLKADDEKMKQLTHAVKATLDFAQDADQDDVKRREIEELAIWANNTFVRGYFIAMAARHYTNN